MFRTDRGWQGKATWTRLVIAAFVLSLGPGAARAESAKQEPPAATAKASKKSPAKKAKKPAEKKGEAKAPAKTAYVPIEKPDGTQIMPMRQTKMSDRMNAGIRLYERQQAAKAAEKAKSAPATESSGGSGLRSAVTAVLRMAVAQTTPTFPQPIDLFASPNYAYSKLPTATCLDKNGAVVNDPNTGLPATCMQDSDCPGYATPILVGVNVYPAGSTCTGAVQPNTGIRKFVDSLVPLCPLGKNNLQNCIPIATPDTTTFAGADYYELGLKDYFWQFHSDLPKVTDTNATRLRGYYQKNATASPVDPAAAAGSNAYLGPVIVARTNRPVRVWFQNELPTGHAGDLFLPTDTVLEGAGDGPAGIAFTNNRAAIHLHGGNTPWISDGTQHQWTAPKGQASVFPPPYVGQDLKGWAVQDVPDMWFDSAGNAVPASTVTCQPGTNTCSGVLNSATVPVTNNPGDGRLTFYWTNQQSGRLMFFHDHAYGITRLNVHAGEAAGYLLVNPPDEDALAAAGVPGTIGSQFFIDFTGADLGHMFPLVIQDKTFVPPLAQLARQDPSWDTGKWGGEGAMWYPHVYTPNQWPDNPDGSGTNPWGHWDYGPWFWPAQNTLTEVVGGVVVNRPLTVPCYTAALPGTPGVPNTNCPSTPDQVNPANPVSAIPESFLDTPVINGVAYPTLTVDPTKYRFQILNASQERNWNLSWFVAGTHDAGGAFVPVSAGTEVAMVPAVPHGPAGTSTVSTTPPLCDPTAPRSDVTGLPFGPDLGAAVCWPATWPTDSRQGGVPDPASAGPQWLQIGSEAGLLPAVARIPPTPVGFEQNKRNIVVLNVSTKGLFMGPAERADVIVDFSQYAGKTLILYNDAPAPVPAGDTRLDPYTGAPDQSLSGGAPTTLAGYGPNVRTIMQVNVNPGTGAMLTGAQVATIEGALGQRFKLSQPAPIVPEAAYTSLYAPAGTSFTNTYLPIQQVTSMTFTPIATDALGNPCDGTNCPVPQANTYKIQNKTIQELFTLNFGRMNSLLGTEIPTTNFQNQTTIPFDNYDPATDFFSDGEIQIWKITHNGVDTHTIHFHLLNLQVINRVGWDGQVRPPDANEIGWKESIRMNPLEDIYVALRPVKQNLPWPLPDKNRPMDVIRPLGTSAQFTQLDIFNQPIAITNAIQNYGWEYVWHCHLLGHEEEDMLRAEVFVVAPEAPSGFTAIPSGIDVSSALLSWTEQAKSTMKFHVQRSTDPGFPATTATTDFFVDPPSAPTDQRWPNPTIPGTVISASDTGLAAGSTYYYRVRSEKTLTSPAVKDTQGGPVSTFTAASAWVNATKPIGVVAFSVTPLSLDFGNVNYNTVSTAQSVTITTSSAVPLALTSGITGDFAVSGTACLAGLTASTPCTISVTFKPTAPGTRTGTLTLTSASPAQTIQVALTGFGLQPVAQYSTTAIAFGNQLFGSTTTLPLTIQNAGSAALTVSLVQSGSADFTVAGSCPSIAPNASCTYQVTFKPSGTPTNGARAGSLAFTTNDPVTPAQTVTLSGTSIAPIIGVTPTSLAFGSLHLGTSSTPRTFTITNTGNAPLTPTIGAPTGAGTDFVATIPAGCASLITNQSCTVSVVFTPSANGLRSATMAISSNDPTTPLVNVTLSGTGTSVTVVTTPLTFAPQLVGTTSAQQTVAVTNNGTASVTLTRIASAGYTIATAPANDCTATLAGNATCVIAVTFTPTTLPPGPVNGTLTVSASDGSSSIVSLSGTSIAPIATVTPNPLTINSSLNASVTQLMTITNTGTAALTVNGISVSSTQFAVSVTSGCIGAANAMQPGASCQFVLTFTPTSSTTPKTGTLTVTVAAPATNVTVPLTGNVLVPTYTVVAKQLPSYGGVNGTFTQNATTGSYNFALTFPKVSVPQKGTATAILTVTNTSTVPMNLRATPVSVTNNQTGTSFTATTTCTTPLAAGAACDITVLFTPASVGGKTGSLNFRPANNPPLPTAITLSGTGGTP